MNKLWWKTMAGLATGLTLVALPVAGQNTPRILSVDHHADVVSTAPAATGQTMRLYLRERLRAGVTPDASKVVLFVHGARTPAEVSFDVPYSTYSWMAYLAEAGYDVFSVDMEGYGRSQRPTSMTDTCNLSDAQRGQQKAAAGCKRTHERGATTLASDWNDITAAVNYITKLRGASQVSLVGWSQGGPRTGGWAAQNPERVNKLVLLAPAYNRNAGLPAAPGARGAASGRGGAPNLAAFSTQTQEEFTANWDKQAPCKGQYEPAAKQSVWTEMLASDPVGANWNPAVVRAPVTAPSASWTADMVKNTRIPTLMAVGAHDGQVNPQNVRNLYEDIGSEKAFVELACSSHNAMWEKNHLLLFAASREWLDKGTVNGQKNVMLKIGE
jgi:pimeloyl-ACP methyl ester carboxylesterase